MLIKVKDRVRIPPTDLDKPLKEALRKAIEEEYNLKLDRRKNIQFIHLVSIDSIEDKIILPNDGAVYVDVIFTYLAFKPLLGEVIEGIVTNIIEKGAFINLGYFDGFAHKSQVMEDFVEYNPNNKVFIGKTSKRTLKIGDKVKARIVSISYGYKESMEIFQIGLTMRQPGLGSYSWEEKKK